MQDNKGVQGLPCVLSDFLSGVALCAEGGLITSICFLTSTNESIIQRLDHSRPCLKVQELPYMCCVIFCYAAPCVLTEGADRSKNMHLLAPQSGALIISAYRDFQSQSLPLIAFKHLSLYTVF